MQLQLAEHALGFVGVAEQSSSGPPELTVTPHRFELPSTNMKLCVVSSWAKSDARAVNEVTPPLTDVLITEQVIPDG
jgi:hypothetical protein